MSKFRNPDGTRTKEYAASVIHQLENWRDGRPLHNKSADECCPDFSCCVPDMFTNDNDKRARIANDEIAQLRMVQ